MQQSITISADSTEFWLADADVSFDHRSGESSLQDSSVIETGLAATTSPRQQVSPGR
jgi:hypothetical protein